MISPEEAAALRQRTDRVALLLVMPVVMKRSMRPPPGDPEGRVIAPTSSRTRSTISCRTSSRLPRLAIARAASSTAASAVASGDDQRRLRGLAVGSGMP